MMTPKRVTKNAIANAAIAYWKARDESDMAYIYIACEAGRITREQYDAAGEVLDQAEQFLRDLVVQFQEQQETK